MATSTAKRFRNRLGEIYGQFNINLVVLNQDSVVVNDGKESWRFRNRRDASVLSTFDRVDRGSETRIRKLQDLNSCAAVDFNTTTYRSLKPGDKITLMTDSDRQYETNLKKVSDSVVVLDSKVIRKSQRKTLSDFVQPKDDGFITDKDYLRHRVKSDSCVVEDGFQKSITRESFVINSKVRFDDIVLTDDIEFSFSGVIRKTLTDDLSVTDQRIDSIQRNRLDSLSLTDDSIELRQFRRVLFEIQSGESQQDPDISYAEVTDDIIVSRSAVNNLKTLTDSIAFFDQLAATRTTVGLPVSVKILHGIENM